MLALISAACGLIEEIWKDDEITSASEDELVEVVVCAYLTYAVCRAVAHGTVHTAKLKANSFLRMLRNS